VQVENKAGNIEASRAKVQRQTQSRVNGEWSTARHRSTTDAARRLYESCKASCWKSAWCIGDDTEGEERLQATTVMQERQD